MPDPGALPSYLNGSSWDWSYEIFQEATVLAIFFFLGSQIRGGNTVQIDRAKSVLGFIFVASLIFSVNVFLFRDAVSSPS